MRHIQVMEVALCKVCGKEFLRKATGNKKLRRQTCNSAECVGRAKNMGVVFRKPVKKAWTCNFSEGYKIIRPKGE